MHHRAPLWDLSKISQMVDPAIMCHPANWQAIRDKLPKPGACYTKSNGGRVESFMGVGQPTGVLFGPEIPIITSVHMERTRKTGKVIFPKDRFIEYEEKDAAWMVPAGLAIEEEEMLFYVVDRGRSNFMRFDTYMPKVFRPSFISLAGLS